MTSNRTRRFVALATAFAVGLTVLSLPLLVDFGPYARNSGPILVHVSASHARHLVDVVVLVVLVFAAIVLAKLVL